MSRLTNAAQRAFATTFLSMCLVLPALACLFPFSLPTSAQIVNLTIVQEFEEAHQHFACSLDYAPAKCTRDLRVLFEWLERYNGKRLGDWQWVIVSRSEWKPFCSRLGVDFLSPAMTSFVYRQTFFDEALFEPEPIRAGELLRKFGTPWKDLLPLAVTHELGHAVCRDPVEARAEYFAQELRQHRAAHCESTSTAIVWSPRAIWPGR